MNAYQLWGPHSRCHLSELSALLNASEDWLWGIMAYLDAEGLVSLDRSNATVCLTASAARTLMARTGGVEVGEDAPPQKGRVFELSVRRPDGRS